MQEAVFGLMRGPPTEAAFGKVLREIRRAKKLSQEALAEASECHPTYVSQLERGLRSPTLRAVFALAGGLETEPDEIVREVKMLVRGLG